MRYWREGYRNNYYNPNNSDCTHTTMHAVRRRGRAGAAILDTHVISVTRPTSHCERSALNFEAPLNIPLHRTQDDEEGGAARVRYNSQQEDSEGVDVPMTYWGEGMQE